MKTYISFDIDELHNAHMKARAELVRVTYEIVKIRTRPMRVSDIFRLIDLEDERLTILEFLDDSAALLSIVARS